MRTVLITGASSGIGEALAREWAIKFPAEKLILASRRGPYKLDLESPTSIEQFVRELRAANLIPNIVIHNAGLSQRSLACETSIDVDRRLMEVNYFGPVALTKLLLPEFLKRGSGQFVVVTSLAGKFGVRMRSGYAGAKHALHGFFESLRAELAAQYGADAFPVTMICPGFIRTSISMSALTGDGSQQASMDQATGEGMDPAECARRIIDAIEARKLEAVVAGKEKMGVLVKRFAPTLFAKLIQKAKVV